MIETSLEDIIFLTFDIDWAADDVIRHTLKLLQSYRVSATFFVTHPTELWDEIRANYDVELGMHPNFTLDEGCDISSVIEALKAIVPEAVCVRAHCLTQNTRILSVYEKLGIRYNLDDYIPLSANLALKPYDHIGNLKKAPHFFEDDLYLLKGIKTLPSEYLAQKGLKVFDFHPIHIYLNTADLAVYNQAKKYTKDAQMLCRYRNEQQGAESFLIDLIEAGQKMNMKFCKISEMAAL